MDNLIKCITPCLVIAMLLYAQYFKLNVDHSVSNLAQVDGEIVANRFLEPRNSCSVNILTSETDLQDYLNNTNPENTTCSWEVMAKYFIDNKIFHTEGAWFAPDNGTISPAIEFYPQGCNFGNELTSLELLLKCFSDNNFTRILITGDSNSRHLYDSLTEMITNYANQSGGTCRGITADDTHGCPSESDFTSDFYGVPGIPNRALSCTTPGFGIPCCAKYNMTCSFNDMEAGTTLVELEYLPVMHFLDSTLRLLHENYGDAEANQSAETKMEYLLKYYLRHYGYPDLWIFEPPFHHDAWVAQLDKLENDINYVLDMIDVYVPMTTRIVMLSCSRECFEMTPQLIRHNFVNAWGVPKTVRLNDMNNVLYDVLQERMNGTESRFHLFLNGITLSCPVECRWHEDGGHLESVWYSKLIKYILEMFCVSS